MLTREQVVISDHAVTRMAQEGLTVVEILIVLNDGAVIEDYPNDWPYPSRLMIGRPEGRPVHVVAATHPDGRRAIVITAYRPRPDRFEPPEFVKRMRRSS